MIFYVGLHHPHTAPLFARCMISANALRRRRGDFWPRAWMMDSGAFTEIAKHGAYRFGVEEYAEQIFRWSRCGELVAAVSQDFMCEPFVLQKTGGTVASHQAQTVERYAALRRLVSSNTYVLPVLQGWHPSDYVEHVRAYGSLLPHSAWVGVGSVCKRNSNPESVAAVLEAIKRERPDLRLHGFGVKLTALADERVRSLLHTADSMAWSFAARKQGRNANDPEEARKYVERIERQSVQRSLFPL